LEKLRDIHDDSTQKKDTYSHTDDPEMD